MVNNPQTQMQDRLRCLTSFQGEILAWDRSPSQWQSRIKQAIASNKFPHYLIFPQTKSSLAQIVKLAYENNWKIMPAGSGTKLNWGNLLPQVDLAICTSQLNSPIEHAAEDLVVTAGAGVKLVDLQAKLAKKNQFLPIDPVHEGATIGGIVATADTGCWRQGYGGVRDLVLGISFVRSDGQIAKAGGRVVKNVAGYDLMKLFTGSYGTLGIISQVTFRLYPIPETSATAVLAGGAEEIARARGAIVASGLTPTAAELLAPSLVGRLTSGEKIGLIIRFQSIRESVEQQVERVSSLSETLGLQFALYRGGDELILWQQIGQLGANFPSEEAILCKIGILPSRGIDFFNQFDELGSVNLSTGLGKVYLEPDKSLDCLRAMRDFCQLNQGFLSILESPAGVKEKIEPWGYRGNAIAIAQKLKAKFDPKNILSPNRLF